MKRVFIFFFIFIFIGLAGADVPVRQEQFIYSIMAFNGKDYSGTFCGENSDSIYLIAEQDNFITVRKTLVYYWPITEDWKTDTSALNYPFEGTLELTEKGGESRIINPERYTFYNVQGEYKMNWEVATGDEAEKAWQHYQDLVNEYWQITSQYQQEKMTFEMIMNELTKKITELRNAGADVTELVEKLKTLKMPEPPQPPDDYIVPPSPVQSAFILNLPKSEYSIRFVNEDGAVMEGSEKRLVVFEKRRAEGIGFEVIPGDKWTRPVELKTPASVLYVDGTTNLYLRPFFQDEFNDLYYQKMIKNDTKGNPRLMNWVRIQQVPGARIELSENSHASEVILEEPFYVEQTKGSALGYKIIPFDPEGAHKDREPSLIAFKVPVNRERSLIKFKLLDKSGLNMAGSSRQVRVIIKSRWQPLLFLLCLLPLLAMVVVRVIRSRKYSL
ncbi:MAG: hypothetical protein GH155_06475 [Spirochaeta sp.]|nr:hypothetical protein [Spirochaeta sp.]